MEGADRKFEWTDERRELSARAAILTKQVRNDTISGEEALMLTLYPPSDPRFEKLVQEQLEFVPRTVEHGTTAGRSRAGRAPEQVAEERKQRERDRYHNDPDYHARRLAQMKARRNDPEWRRKDAERKRRARARAKEAKQA